MEIHHLLLLLHASITEIPQWVKNNAEWWADDQIDDASFVSGIQYLINQGIMKIPEHLHKVVVLALMEFLNGLKVMQNGGLQVK